MARYEGAGYDQPVNEDAQTDPLERLSWELLQGLTDNVRFGDVAALREFIWHKRDLLQEEQMRYTKAHALLEDVMKQLLDDGSKARPVSDSKW